jgi:hypothetical protein
LKKKEKKERKDKERAERAEREKAEKDGAGGEEKKDEASTPDVAPKSSSTPPPEPSTSAGAGDAAKPGDVDELKSPATDGSTGVRTPTSKRPPRNPWTLFMRMSVSANEAELKEFFGEAKGGVSV